jgi:TRAP transporter TAXI family solute receptor
MLAAWLFAIFLWADHGDAKASEEQRQMVNQSTVTVLGGSVTGTYSRLIWDMASLFDDGYDFRVVPVLGKGSIKGVEDLLYLDGIDIALLQSDVLDFFASNQVYPNLRDSLRYIAVLFNEEIHVVARDEISSVRELVGKKVSFGPSSSGTFMTSSIIFQRLDIDVDAVDYSNQEGLERLKRGEIDAMVRVAGAPTSLLKDVTAADHLHILPLPPIDGAYLNATITHDQYPGLVPEGKEVRTLAVGALMVAYNWPKGHPRHHRIQQLVDRLGEQLGDLQRGPFHTKWRQVSLEKTLPGWVRWQPVASPPS